jgi:hypothetical protein
MDNLIMLNTSAKSRGDADQPTPVELRHIDHHPGQATRATRNVMNLISEKCN